MKRYQLDGAFLKKIMMQAYRTIDAEKEIINGLNVFPVPDGDTGTNMSLTIKSAVDMIQRQNPDSITDVAQVIAKGALMGARGNSGVILSQILGGFSKGIRDLEEVSVKDFKKALDLAVTTAYKAVIKPVEGTILTVVRESVKALDEMDLDAMDFTEFFKHLVHEAQISLDNTPKKLHVLKKAGVVDAGGRGLVSIFTGFYHACVGKAIELQKPQESDASIFAHSHEGQDITFTYCTEFILHQIREDDTDLRQEILSLGDSVVYVRDDDLLKIHVHTDHPGKALEAGLAIGDLLTVKIENMREQNKNFNVEPVEDIPEIGVVSVCAGDGFSDIFNDLGVSYVIEGGQTMNPSTADILKAIEQVKSDKVIILPNNSNIILAANQAKEVSEKQVAVIPTKTIPEGIAAMLQYDADQDLDEIVEAMTEMKEDVDTLQITHAVRDTDSDGRKIKKNDFIALLNGEIIDSDKRLQRLLKRNLENCANDYDLITVYYGEDIDIREVEQLITQMRKDHEDIDLEVYHGGQPIYYYIVSLE